MLPQRPGLPVVPLSVVVDTDVSIILVPYAGFAQVLGVVASGIVESLLHSRHTAVAEEVTNGWGKKSGRIKLTNQNWTLY